MAADDVDRIVSAWRRERPDLDVGPLEVLSRVSRLARRLDLARGTAFAEHGLDGWEFDVLSALRRAGNPYELSPGQLVAETLVTSGTMTNRVDRLGARGSSSASPTPATGAASSCGSPRRAWRSVDAALADLLAHEHVAARRAGAAERDDLAALLRRLLRPVRVRRLTGASTGARRDLGTAGLRGKPYFTSRQRVPVLASCPRRGRQGAPRGRPVSLTR